MVLTRFFALLYYRASQTDLRIVLVIIGVPIMRIIVFWVFLEVPPHLGKLPFTEEVTINLDEDDGQLLKIGKEKARATCGI